VCVNGLPAQLFPGKPKFSFVSAVSQKYIPIAVNSFEDITSSPFDHFGESTLCVNFLLKLQKLPFFSYINPWLGD
jgi:hypothetical protein